MLLLPTNILDAELIENFFLMFSCGMMLHRCPFDHQFALIQIN